MARKFIEIVYSTSICKSSVKNGTSLKSSHLQALRSVFRKASGHGQEVHLLQMDYVEPALTRREQFWYYSTKEGRGDWVWDTLNNTIMHPEYIGPIIRRYIPLY